MISVYIWGAGDYAKDAFSALDLDHFEFKGFIDKSVEKQGTLWEDKYPIVSPESAVKDAADYYLISVLSAVPIIRQAIGLGIDRKQLVRFWEDKLEEYPFFDDVFLLRRENAYLKKRLENAPYEFGKEPALEMMSNEELFKLLADEKKSFARYGDGEFEMIRQKERPWFQHVDKKLSERLSAILQTKQDEVIIGIADNFGNLDKYTNKAADSIRDYVSGETRSDIMAMLLPDYRYADAYITRPYYIYKDKSYIQTVIAGFKRVWNNRNILLLENPYSRIGVGNDLFETAKSVRRILCPHKNAFEKIDEIFTITKNNLHDDDLVLISLGPTATVLAYDLGMDGVQAIDIGQIDTEYEWYLRGATDREEIPGKSVAELSWWHEPEMVDYKEEYEKQVIGVVRG